MVQPEQVGGVVPVEDQEIKHSRRPSEWSQVQPLAVSLPEAEEKDPTCLRKNKKGAWKGFPWECVFKQPKTILYRS